MHSGELVHIDDTYTTASVVVLDKPPYHKFSPGAQVERDTWSETCLSNTKDKAYSGQLLPIIGRSHASCNSTP